MHIYLSTCINLFSFLILISSQDNFTMTMKSAVFLTILAAFAAAAPSNVCFDFMKKRILLYLDATWISNAYINSLATREKTRLLRNPAIRPPKGLPTFSQRAAETTRAAERRTAWRSSGVHDPKTRLQYQGRVRLRCFGWNWLCKASLGFALVSWSKHPVEEMYERFEYL